MSDSPVSREELLVLVHALGNALAPMYRIIDEAERAEDPEQGVHFESLEDARTGRDRVSDLLRKLRRL